MAVLVGVGSMFATFAQAQNVALQVAAAGGSTKLFNSNGSYAVERNTLNNSKGQIFNFFGYDWYLVNINDSEEVATFWMVEPYGSNSSYRYAFNSQIESGTTDSNLFNEGKTLWRNGYSNSVWENKDLTLGESQIRATMRDIAKAIIDNSSYKNYKNKVVAGYVEGSNMDNKDAKQPIGKGGVYCSVERTTSLDRIVTPDQSMTAYYTLDSTDRLWLPATEEVRNNGFWRLSNEVRNWQRTTVDSVVWLRSAVNDHSAMAQLVGYSTTINNENGLVATQEQSFFKHYVDQKHGVRPAIHLSLKNYGEGNGNGGWFTDDMMKVFFIIICVLGIIGVILVIIAVVAKARRDKEANEQDRQNA